jgi:hypothetical protein
MWRVPTHTCGKIVSLVNSYKFTITSLIKLIKHVTFIMKACIPSIEESLHTCGKIVSLVNSHKLTITSLINLIKHVTFIMIACNPSIEISIYPVLMETGYTSLHLTCGKIVSLVKGANRPDKRISNVWHNCTSGK